MWAKVLDQIWILLIQKYKLKRNLEDEICDDDCDLVMKVILIKEVMSCDVSPVAMFKLESGEAHWGCPILGKGPSTIEAQSVK